MSFVRNILAWASLWIDHVASAILAWRETLRPRRFARLVEHDDGSFTLENISAPDSSKKRSPRQKAPSNVPREPFRIVDGAIAPKDAARLAPFLSHAWVELVLRADRFLFRPLQLPRRASDFLEGIIRSQIDRLTPWNAAEAAIGWQPAADLSGDRINLTIVATAKSLLAPFVNAIRAFGVEAITISTPAPNADGGTIKVLEQRIIGAREAHLLRRGLIILIVALALVCGASIIASYLAGGELGAERNDLNAKIAQRRAELHQGGDANSQAAQALQQKKHETPSIVIVFEELSRILPDDCYLTELRMQGDKMQIVGLARDPPELIHLIEQSPHFKHATFFAPTTRLPSESRQHFFIEAHVEPVFPTPKAVGQ